MNLRPDELAHLFLAISALLVAAHGSGYVFAKYRQPRVIGEVVGGIALGPSVLGVISPAAFDWLFPAAGITPPVLGVVHHLGLVLLMFCAGVEVRGMVGKAERKTILLVTACGTLLPLAAALVFLTFFDVAWLQGSAGNPTSFLLIFAIAVAVTSIPVISRIMYDLNVLETSFARIVLSSAIIEDMLLYVALAVALALAGYSDSRTSGFASSFGIAPGTVAFTAYHVVIAAVFFSFSLIVGHRLYGWSESLRLNFLHRASPVGHQLVFLLLTTWVCTFFGIATVFGAFIAGMMVGKSPGAASKAGESIKAFSFAFFIPAYFALVGLNINLAEHLDIGFFLLFALFACIAKGLGVYFGARLAQESSRTSWNLAIAMNARGGPGIVLASVAYGAQIINESFYVALVLLAILTSLLAGTWLGRVARSGRPLR